MIKVSKKPYFGVILDPISPNLGKNEYSWKNGSVMMQKIRKKMITHSREKHQTEGWTDRQTTLMLQDPLLDRGPKTFDASYQMKEKSQILPSRIIQAIILFQDL